MSIAGVGSQGSGNLSQILSGLLSKLDKTSSTSTTATYSEQSGTTVTAAADGGLTGSTKPSLSNMILGTLMQMQHQSESDGASEGAASASGAASNPVSDLFSSMDADADGSVTQSELETFIQGAGGTTDQADSLYEMLGGDDTGISEDQLASQMPPPPPGGGHGGPGGPGGPPPSGGSDSKSVSGTDLVDALDSDEDGCISQSELTDFVTATGGTEDDATSLFSSLSSDGTSGITASDIDTAIKTATAKYASDPYASILAMLNGASASGTATASSGSAVSISA